ncbi:hypothetical protein RHSIM_Rhsim11G0010700 [Rhododendron simsii]|uniref:ATP-dependent DNA helicase n=1 Tax=Rhododendron simsii TaxID=118357 RepID=A0A834GC29_RHOSS|nr:hypothetical protein RHSIM_Rhsim11G0010700 [Rhododendron simsii]
MVDAWAATEQNRLTYYKLNQARLRTSMYQDLTDIRPNGLDPDQIGQRNYFSSIAHQTAIDHPDLVSRDFKLKRKALMKEVEQNKVFSQKVAHVYTIEFQKRGLPHMHVLFFLKGGDKIRSCVQVGQLVCAEFPNREDDPELFETVKSCMVHGPCGTRNSHAACMEKGKCTKRYPRDFIETTTMDENGYPIYHRRDDGKVHIIKEHEVDNRDIVPYNPHLSKIFNCHINVEVCAGMRCVKYIHKYIYKGYDRTTMVLGSANEIKQYLDGRYIGPPEAAWHIFSHHMHEEVPTVTQLALHLPGMHRVNFNPKESLEDIIARTAVEKLTLTGFFAWYAANPNSTPYTYQEFPQYFVWDKTNNVWTPRKLGFAIGRMYFASPNCGEKFYLRLLLTIVKGPKSYKDLRTVDNVVYDAFKSACVARGLLEDGDEWVQCLEEAAIMQTGYQLRRLFYVILTQCSPLQPLELWKRFFINICDDLAHKIHTLFGILNPTEAQIEDYGLYLLNQMLEETGKTFLYNTIAHKCRSLSHIVVTVASSGIASQLLEGGRTAHSTFAIPLDVLENFICGFTKQSLQADLFRETKLIIWDEVPMQHKYCVEAVDRTLCDIRDNPKPFGGITVVLGGDFRQILPVVPKGVREEIVNASLRRSDLWDDICVSTLNLNMLEQTLEKGTASIGNRYPYLAADKISEDDRMDRSISNRYPNEYLNSLDPTGLPPFKLELKVGCPIILLRNIAPKDGLCNGTRMMVVRCGFRIIEVKILTGEKFGKLAFIPRISLSLSSSNFPFHMTRRQFPVRLAYAMTINKSQGQSMKFVGVDLRTPVFSHGQLYVALSRCTSFDRITVLLPEDDTDSTTNIVYPEILL